MSLMIAAGFIFGTAGTAFAVVERVGGGWWDHGIANGYVYSNYYHETVCHGSTAVGTYTLRASAPAGKTSVARVPKARTNNQTYWRTSC
ncbi:lactococcin 972 family bacteriocin [Thermobifida halotolerans]|uniref:Lactococcin 972 family bacteriocin n=1 Tax=Thermobifida halotolerans TaxID=483545 RepID=A0AA97M4F0_9ACTN|nr:lactococcin 972 family bacteriocin [Thermobifida halotolerans]UOE19907.1 lactococcin 972 family bacteriocin [Thermobifida halotolerans]